MRYISFLALGLVTFFSGCSGGAGGGDGGASAGGTITPVGVVASISPPDGLAQEDLTVVTSFDTKMVGQGSTTTVRVNDNNVQVVAAVNKNNNPVLLAIVTDISKSNVVNLSVQSTAVALVYLSPGVAQSTKDEAERILSLINSLPQTNVLASLLNDKLNANIDIFSTAIQDPDILSSLTSAVNAVMQNNSAIVQAQFAAVNRASVKPVNKTTTYLSFNPEYASGVELMYDTNGKYLEGRNYVKRVAKVYDVTENTELFTIDSISTLSMITDGILNSELYKVYTSATCNNFDVNKIHTIKIYGLGLLDLTSTTKSMTEDDWNRLYPVAIESIIMDVISPAIGTIVGVNDIRYNATSSFLKYINKVNDAIDKIDLQKALIEGDGVTATRIIVFKSIDILTANDYEMLRLICAEVNIKKGGTQAIISGLSSLNLYAKVLQLGGAVGDGILAAFSLKNTKLMDTITFEPDGVAVLPRIFQDIGSGYPGTTFNQWGKGFSKGRTATFHVKKPDLTENQPFSVQIKQDGTFDIPYTADAKKAPGTYTWWVVDDLSGKYSNQLTYTIWDSSTLKPTVAQQPSSGAPGTIFAQWGTGFTPNSKAYLHVLKPDLTEYDVQPLAIDQQGAFSLSYSSGQGKANGKYQWWVVDGPSNKQSNIVTYSITQINPSVGQTPANGQSGTVFVQTGCGFSPNSIAIMHVKKPDNTEYAPFSQPIDALGSFSVKYSVPSDKAPGNYTWWVIDATGKKSNEVIYKITNVAPRISQSPSSGPGGTTFVQTGSGFTLNGSGTVHAQYQDGSETANFVINFDNNGDFSTSYESHTDKAPGVYTWWVIDGASGLSSNRLNYTIEVKPTIAQLPMSGPPGTTFEQWGTGFTPNSTGELHVKKPDGSEYDVQLFSLSSTGTFDIPYPSGTGKAKGKYDWWVIDGPTRKKSNVVTYTIH